MVTSFQHYNDVTDRAAVRFCFLSFPWAGTKGNNLRHSIDVVNT